MSVVQRLAHQVHYPRKRLRDAAAYLDRLAAKAEATAREPWRGRYRASGAAVIQVRGGGPASGAASETVHPDNHHCMPPVRGREAGG